MSFDPQNRQSWYFGPISRQDATDLLMSEKDGGVFLVRDSTSIPGDFVLCVKEDCKVCHYIINKVVEEPDAAKYRIGDRSFPDLPSLLSFYKLHYLDTTPLVRPANRKQEKVQAKHDFEGNDPEDLPFKKGDVLIIIRKDEEQWWTAKNALGRVGAIPVPYVKPYPCEDRLQEMTSMQPLTKSVESIDSGVLNESNRSTITSTNSQRKLPDTNKETFARVKQARVPNAYDDTALKLQIGDIIRVTKINISGQWEGELVLEDGKGGRKGHFPFTHVELINYDPSSTNGGTAIQNPD